MIIAFAFGIIGALLVLAYAKFLRKTGVLLIAFILSAGIAAAGIYFMNDMPKDTEKIMLFPVFTPLATLVLLEITRIIYKARTNLEIIIHMHGLIPVRQEERYVTATEKNITYLLLVLAVLIPYFILKLIL